MSSKSRRPSGSRASSSRATSSATTRAFTRPTPSRASRPPARRPARGLLRSTQTRSTRSGPIGRPRRSARSSPHKLRFAGESAAAKIARVRAGASAPSHGLLISDPHNLAWLFNIRGSDVSYTPLPLGCAYLPLEGRPVAVPRRQKADAGDPTGSRAARRTLLEPDALLERSSRNSAGRGRRVAFDAATVPAYLTQALERAGGKAEVGADPITLMKAKKNAAELAGARAAHERDGAAMARFLAWFAARGAARPADGNRRRQGSGDVPAREPGAQGYLVPDHRRRRAEFGHPPLSGQRSLQPQDRAGHFPHRQRRAIRGRHDRHHPHDRRRSADRARCATASPAC